MTQQISYHDQATSSQVASHEPFDLESSKGLSPPPQLPPNGTLTPISSRISRTRNLYSTRSCIDSHGTYASQPEETPEDNGSAHSKHADTEDEKFKEVSWDGEEDLMNPKNMPTWKVSCGAASTPTFNRVMTLTAFRSG